MPRDLDNRPDRKTSVLSPLQPPGTDRPARDLDALTLKLTEGAAPECGEDSGRHSSAMRRQVALGR